MTRPNIVFVMADDHAAHAIGAYGSRINRTPGIDRLAREGMRFDACFCTNSICSPSGRPDEWELFDLATDPWELTSLHDDPAHAGLLAEMRDELDRLAAEVGDALLERVS